MTSIPTHQCRLPAGRPEAQTTWIIPSEQRDGYDACCHGVLFSAAASNAMSTSTATAAPAFAAALSTTAATRTAAEEVCRAACDSLAGPADLGMVFVSPHHLADVAAVAAVVARQTGARVLLGSTAEGIVGGAKEIENQPAISLWLARLPGVSLTPMHLVFERTREGGTIVGWPENLPTAWPEGAALLALGEPYSFPTDLLLNRIN